MRRFLPLLQKWSRFSLRAHSQAHHHSRAGLRTSRINLFGSQVPSFAIVFVIALKGKLTDPDVTPCPLTSPDVTVSFGTLSLLVPADTIITLTTTSGQDKAGPLDIPPDAPFPLPYSEHYEGSPGQPAKARRVPHASVVCFHSPAVPR